jgi:hypothetical protein
MPYKLRKAPKRELYWVVSKETGDKHSNEPLPKDRAKAQMRALYASEKKQGGGLGLSPVYNAQLPELQAQRTEAYKEIRKKQKAEQRAWRNRVEGIPEGELDIPIEGTEEELDLFSDRVKQEMELRDKAFREHLANYNYRDPETRKEDIDEYNRRRRNYIKTQFKEQKEAEARDPSNRLIRLPDGSVMRESTKKGLDAQKKREDEMRWREANPTGAFFKDFGQGIQYGYETLRPVLEAVPGVGTAFQALGGVYDLSKELTDNFGEGVSGQGRFSAPVYFGE